MSAFLTAFLFIGMAEMGDKSQLVALAFATRFSPWVTLGGVLLGALLVHLCSVTVGGLLGLALPTFWIQLGAGAAFIGFGLWTLRQAAVQVGPVTSRFGPFLTVLLTFFLGELGDKTMLTSVALASQQQQFVPVWLGASLGMFAADALAIGVGLVVGKRLPRRAISFAAALIFLGFGIWEIAAALSVPR